MKTQYESILCLDFEVLAFVPKVFSVILSSPRESFTTNPFLPSLLDGRSRRVLVKRTYASEDVRSDGEDDDQTESC